MAKRKREQPKDDGPEVEWQMPPLLEQSMKEGKSGIEHLLTRRMLGLYLWLVPLRLMPYRGAARMMVGTLLAYEPDDLCDSRVRTIDGEPYWVFVSKAEPHPERSKFAKLRELTAKPAKKGKKRKA
ncbi:MAG TPA: hypothetical protein VNL94_06715 [Candidatus Binatia bacterium]|nr:hypothetical protein [Candidatus Binatia bacterium]